jgi:hypothetical protein
MPPIQPSLRGSLLTGASALAMSVSTSGAQAQSATGSLPASPPTTTVWVEGALSLTDGGSFNVPSFPGLGAPYTSFNARNGFEAAIGFDYRWPNQPWHFVFDFRYGQSGTATANSASSSSSSSHFFKTSGVIFSSIFNTTTIDKKTTNSTTAQAVERERHIVADFMVGRDIGVGANAPQVQFGFRIADLRATGQAQGTTQSTTRTDTQRTFYSSSAFPSIVTTKSSTTSSSSSSFFARWNSRFFGVGPRIAVVGGVPIAGTWSFDYGAGIAELYADRSLDLSVWTTPGGFFGAKFSNNDFVFNADGSLAVSYKFTNNYKFSVGVRGDFYNAALLTFNPANGGVVGTNRVYWGPFVRLTGTF